jgi:pyridoxal phosphate enzyme (YggS family)
MSCRPSDIAGNVAGICSRMAAAAARSGRTPDEVRLVAVTKYAGLDEIRALLDAGCLDLGESRPQQLWDRAAALGDLPIRWHVIGHLQRNKVERTLPLVSLIHSLDSYRLAQAIHEASSLRLHEKQPDAESRAMPKARALLEVNISGESAKHGLVPGEVESFLPQLAALGNIEICGLMCMAGLEGGAEEARREFAALRTLRDTLKPRCPDGIDLRELSMGMSGDYEIAIEEGATIVRIGSALFEKRADH